MLHGSWLKPESKTKTKTRVIGWLPKAGGNTDGQATLHEGMTTDGPKQCFSGRRQAGPDREKQARTESKQGHVHVGKTVFRSISRASAEAMECAGAGKRGVQEL